jgi:hypothetical protein
MQDRRVLAQEALYNLGERQPMRSWRIPAVSLAVIATALVFHPIVAACN